MYELTGKDHMFERMAESLANEMFEISKHVSDDENIFFNEFGKGAHSLPAEQHQKLFDLAEKLLEKTKSASRISLRYAFKETLGIFNEQFANEPINPKEIAPKLAAMMNEWHNYSREQTLYLRVKGLKLSKPLNLGGVEFVMCNDRIAEQFLTQMYEKIGFAPGKQSNALNERFADHFEEHCIAVYRVVAEPFKAFERAHDETRRALEILRYASVPMTVGKNVKFGLDGDPSFAEDSAFVSSTEILEGEFSPDAKIEDFRIDDFAAIELEQLGALQLAGFLNEPKPSEFKESLLRAVHWLSSALTQQEKENKYLHLIIALEALFSPKSGDPISNTIAESTAIVVSHHLKARLDTKAEVKKCYSRRSAIAHGGRTSVTENDLGKLTVLVWNAIRSLLFKTDEFIKHDDLRNHLENCKFSGDKFREL
jgi:hypothetical protein